MNRFAAQIAAASALLALGVPGVGRGADAPQEPSPFVGQGIDRGKPYTPAEIKELDDLARTVHDFEQDAKDYRQSAREIIEYKYKQKRKILARSYEKIIEKLEGEQRKRRQSAIDKFEAFLRRYPNDQRYTPDAMFRLSELYYERSYALYFRKEQAYDKQMDAWDANSGEPEPTEPDFHYEPTIAMMQRLIVEFPTYRLIDGAYYLLGYCLGEQGEDDRAVDVYQELVARFPKSRFAAEVWTRIGEYYFDNNDLQRALHAYSQVLGHTKSRFYDKALYKLAWTHYRLADPQRAPQEFQAAVDTFIALLDFNVRTKKAGHERGRELRKESIQYIAISYADEDWGGMQKMLNYLDAKGRQPYDREIITDLGDVYFDQTRFDLAVKAYRVVQQRYPDDADAPVIQNKIVTAFERQRDFDDATKAREKLTNLYASGTAWYKKNEKNTDALQKADKLTKKSLYTAALFHHKQAQVDRQANKIELAKDEYARAAAAYGKYLQRFPHDKQLYELTFYYAETLYYSLQFLPAAKQYIKVRDSNSDNKFLDDAAFSVILSYENAVKVAESKGELQPVKVLTSTERDPKASLAPQKIPALKKKIVAASDRYAKLEPESAKLPKVLYKAAEIFYTYNHFDEARKRFRAVLDAYPAADVAQYASNLIIESYLAQKNFAAVESFSRKLLERPEMARRGAFSKELVKFKTGAMFKLADGLAAKGEYEKAAALYLKLINENPDNQFADSALNNAAVAYEKVERYDSASKLYQRLVKDYPKSPLADTALFRVGLNAERFFNFDEAIHAYLQLIDEYPKSQRRADAIYNAALALENTQNYDRSAKMYLRYCQLFPKRDDAPDVCFRAGGVYGKMGDYRKVISTYQNFIRKYHRTTDHHDRIVAAYLDIAKAYDHLGRDRDARRYYERCVKEYHRDESPKAAPYAAEAQFNLVERSFDQFKKISFEGSSRQQKHALVKKAKMLGTVKTDYMKILDFKQIEWTLASLYRIGELYQQFADGLVNAPCPHDIKRLARRSGYSAQEVCDQYSVALEEKSANIEDKAVDAYAVVVDRARKLQVVNKWTKLTLVQLNKLRRSEWPLQKPAKYFVDADAVVAPPFMNAAGKPLMPAATTAAADQGSGSGKPGAHPGAAKQPAGSAASSAAGKPTDAVAPAPGQKAGQTAPAGGAGNAAPGGPHSSGNAPGASPPTASRNPGASKAGDGAAP